MFWRFDKPIEVRPGDEIRTTCTYSTVGINRTIFYGESIKDEMCYSFLTYFPHQRSYTQFCTTFKDTQVCKRYLPRLQGVYDDCSWRAFIHGKDMTAVEMTKRVVTECGKTESCSASCSDALDVMSKHPCMHGEIHGYVSEKWPMMKQVRTYRKMCMNPPDVSNPSSAGAKAEDSKSGSGYLSNNYLAVISAVMFFLRCIVAWSGSPLQNWFIYSIFISNAARSLHTFVFRYVRARATTLGGKCRMIHYYIMYNDTDLSGENIVLCNTEHCFYVDFRLCFVFKNIFKV